jgi:antitoxin ParD1/3/4
MPEMSAFAGNLGEGEAVTEVAEVRLHPKKRHTSQMALITLYMPWTYLKALDELVKRRLYPNRAEALRFAARDLIQLHGER